MKKNIEYILILIAIISILLAGIVALNERTEHIIEKIAKFVAAVVVFNFFMYKLLTGWLFINLSIKAEAERQKGIDGEDDHLKIKITLVKGVTDSVWLEDIQIRLSSVSQYAAQTAFENKIIRPINFKKLHLNYDQRNGDCDAWNGSQDYLYVISSNAETFFSVYDTVPTEIPLSVEIVVLGSRPFYSIGRTKRDKIQWRASLIVLPAT